MLFNSFAFALFLPAVFALYWWAFRSLRAQNAFIVLASWLFYAWWDWRFLGLLLVSTFGDFVIGRALGMEDDARKRKRLLALSLVLNLGILGFFKYFDFFISGLSEVMRAVGFEPHLPVLGILLPVGISFYTFQTLSYTIDIYRRQIVPTRDPVAFAAFVSYFPQLVAGPIERARDLLPQMGRPRSFDVEKAKDGLRQMLWGFFKKVAVADPCGDVADTVFNLDPADASGITLLGGALCFAFQIYGDFSGYSDIAIGCARLFGINLNRNFAYPYFARSIGEFWRKWHISLSSWLRDYVYLPLGGARSRSGRIRNILIVFAVSGLWHGANWTFIVWGVLHGLFYLPEVLLGEKRRKSLSTWRDAPRMLLVFGAVTAAWVVFRSAGLFSAYDFMKHLVLNSTNRMWQLWDWLVLPTWLTVILMLGLEWRARGDQHALARLSASRAMRWGAYLALVVIILLNLRLYDEHAFIYFRF